MTPVEGGDWHFLFDADADLCVIIKTGDEIDIERRVRRHSNLMDDGPEWFGRREAHADCSDPAASADREGEVGSAAGKGHAGAGKRMAATKPLRHTRRNATHLTFPLF